MAWSPIGLTVPQYVDSNGTPYSGAVLKAYAAGTSTPISMATDSTGGTTATSVALNASGYPAVSGNVIIPHVSANYKLALYPTQAAADANSGALWSVDNLVPLGLSLFATVASITALSATLATSAGAALIGYIRAATGAVLRTLQSKADDDISLFDFLTPTQITQAKDLTTKPDVTAALIAAIASLPTPTGGTITVPCPFNAKISSRITFDRAVRLLGKGRGGIIPAQTAAVTFTKAAALQDVAFAMDYLSSGIENLNVDCEAGHSGYAIQTRSQTPVLRNVSVYNGTVRVGKDTLSGHPTSGGFLLDRLCVAFSNTSVAAGAFVVGTAYIVEAVGTTDFTLIGAAANTQGLPFVATGAGTGSGTAIAMRYSNTIVTAGSFVTGVRYMIVAVGTTNFTLIGATASTAGVSFVATGVGAGSGTAIAVYGPAIHICDANAATPSNGGVIMHPRTLFFNGGPGICFENSQHNEVIGINPEGSVAQYGLTFVGTANNNRIFGGDPDETAGTVMKSIHVGTGCSDNYISGAACVQGLLDEGTRTWIDAPYNGVTAGLCKIPVPVTAPSVAAAVLHTTSGSVSVASGVATTLFTLPATTPGVFFVHASNDISASGTFTAAGVVGVTNTNTAAVLLQAMNGAGLALTVSGATVRATQTSGGALDISWSYQRFA